MATGRSGPNMSVSSRRAATSRSTAARSSRVMSSCSATRPASEASRHSRRKPTCAMRPRRNTATLITFSPASSGASKRASYSPFRASPGRPVRSHTTCPLMATSAREVMRSTSRHECMPTVSGTTRAEKNAAPRWFEMLYVPQDRYFSGRRTRLQRRGCPRKVVMSFSRGREARSTRASATTSSMTVAPTRVPRRSKSVRPSTWADRSSYRGPSISQGRTMSPANERCSRNSVPFIVKPSLQTACRRYAVQSTTTSASGPKPPKAFRARAARLFCPGCNCHSKSRPQACQSQ